MSSRREQKEKLRQERLAREQAEKKETARRRRMQILAGAGGAVIIVVVVVVIALAGGGSSASGDLQYASGSVPAGAEVGVTAKPPPWPPNYSHLAQRLSAMGLPQLNEQIFHIHAAVRVYVNGKKVTIPPNVGLDQATRTYSPLHTHDTTGIIHEEADRQYDFTLGQLFAVWGVRFSNDQIGPYKAGGGKALEVYDNGTRATDPLNLVMQAHDTIVVGYGKPGSFPTSFTLNWPPGL
jgi:hypothetical protein